MTPEEQKDAHCDALRDRLWAGRQANYESLDKSILTLSSGALALSLSFLKDLVPMTVSIWFPALITSWVLFVLAISFTLLSTYVSQSAHDRQLENLDAYRRGEDDALDERNNRFIPLLKRFNRLSAACFFGALLATVIFVGVNASKARIMSQANNNQQTEQRGIVPPRLPAPGPAPASPQQPAPPPPAKK